MAVGQEVSGLYIVLKMGGEDILDDAVSQMHVFNREEDFHPAVEVALHQIGAAD